jgi:hypothetical protein
MGLIFRPSDANTAPTVLPDHIQIARKIATEINSMESPIERREALDTIKEIVITQLIEEQRFEEMKVEESNQKIASIVNALRDL